jgi:transposase, IS5 family
MSTRDTAATTPKAHAASSSPARFGVIKRILRRRSAIEAAIGHMKNHGHLGRCHLKGRAGDARILLRLILAALLRPRASSPALKTAS